MTQQNDLVNRKLKISSSFFVVKVPSSLILSCFQGRMSELLLGCTGKIGQRWTVSPCCWALWIQARVCKRKRPQHALIITHPLNGVLAFGLRVPTLPHVSIGCSVQPFKSLHTPPTGFAEEWLLDKLIGIKPTFKKDGVGVVWARISEMPS